MVKPLGISNKDIRNLILEAMDRGWVYKGINSRGHHKIQWVNGWYVQVSNSPSEYRTIKNTLLQIRRVERNHPFTNGSSLNTVETRGEKQQ